MSKLELIKKVQSTFKDEKEHQEVLSFMLNSDLGTWIQGQTEENVHELAILIKQYQTHKEQSI